MQDLTYLLLSCRGLVSLQGYIGAQTKPQTPIPSTASKHARQLPFTPSAYGSALPTQATVSSSGPLPGHAACFSPVTAGPQHQALHSPALSLPDQAVLGGYTSSLPEQATWQAPSPVSPAESAQLPHASGHPQCDLISPALSLPKQATTAIREQTGSIQQIGSEHVRQPKGKKMSRQSYSSVQMMHGQQATDKEEAGEEQPVEAYALSDLWQIFMQEVAQVLLVLQWASQACAACADVDSIATCNVCQVHVMP